MNDLPPADDVHRKADLAEVFLIQGIERLTSMLRRGNNRWDSRSLNQMLKLRSRYEAFNSALEMRVRAAGMDQVLDEDPQ